MFSTRWNGGNVSLKERASLARFQNTTRSTLKGIPRKSYSQTLTENNSWATMSQIPIGQTQDPLSICMFLTQHHLHLKDTAETWISDGLECPWLPFTLIRGVCAQYLYGKRGSYIGPVGLKYDQQYLGEHHLMPVFSSSKSLKKNINQLKKSRISQIPVISNKVGVLYTKTFTPYWDLNITILLIWIWKSWTYEPLFIMQ